MLEPILGAFAACAVGLTGAIVHFVVRTLKLELSREQEESIARIVRAAIRAADEYARSQAKSGVAVSSAYKAQHALAFATEQAKRRSLQVPMKSLAQLIEAELGASR